MIEKDCTKLSGWDAVKCIWSQYSYLWIAPAFIMGFILGAIVPFSGDFYESFKPEMLSIALTITLLYAFDQWRQENRDEKSLKDELLWQVRSQSNEVAKSAIDRIRFKGWLTGEDGLLKGADLSFGKLMGANLTEANLEGTNLEGTNLTEAKLFGVSLVGANLRMANLDKTQFLFANLTKADLSFSTLNETVFAGSDLTDACLLKAKTIRKDKIIFEMTVQSIDSTTKAILPDGTSGNLGDDISRFFDLNHPDIFIPSWVDIEDEHFYL